MLKLQKSTWAIYFVALIWKVSCEKLFVHFSDVLPCFDLCRSNSFHVNITQLGVGGHWWFNYPGPPLDVELEFACLLG